MDIAIGLPNGATDSPPDEVIEWARRADSGPFSSVGVLDRGASRGLEPLAVLAAAAGATSRVGLLTSIVIGPARETTLLARQATTVDALSGGRLRLGLAVGTRERDYRTAGQEFATRGRRFDEQLPALRRLLRGEAPDPGSGTVGPAPFRPGGPPLLVGGYVPAVVRRIVAWADGFVAPGGGEPAAMAELYRQILAAWEAAGRPGRPLWVGASYYALGPHAERDAAAYIERMYGHDRALAARRLAMIPTTPPALLELVRARQADGVDELLLRPCAPGIDQLTRLEDVLTQR